MEGWVESEVPVDGYTATVREFYKSGITCAKRDFGENVRRAYNSLIQGARNTKLPVKVMKRGTIVYLIREQ